MQRFPAWTGSPDQVGYNQVFEQLFQAYERKMPDEAMRDMRDDRSVMEWENIPYECPADRQLGLTFFMTPHKPYLDPFGFINEWSLAIGGVLVMAAVIGIGMFRWGRDCLCGAETVYVFGVTTVFGPIRFAGMCTCERGCCSVLSPTKGSCPRGTAISGGCCSAVPVVQALHSQAEAECWHVSQGRYDQHLHLGLKCVQACLECLASCCVCRAASSHTKVPSLPPPSSSWPAAILSACTYQGS